MLKFIIAEFVQLLCFFLYGNLATKVFIKTSKFRALILDPVLDAFFIFVIPVITAKYIGLSQSIFLVIVVALALNIYATVPRRIGLNRWISALIMMLIDFMTVYLIMKV